MRLHLLTAALPPAIDGIGDYSANLAEQLAQWTDITVLTGQVAPDPIGEIRVVSLGGMGATAMREMTRILAGERPTWLLVQYNPFSYGRWGFNPWLVRSVRKLRRLHACRIALMVHEPFVRPEGPRSTVMSIWQRYQLRELAAAADVVFTSIQSWGNDIAGWCRHPPVHLPVAANTPWPIVSRSEARRRIGVSSEQLVLTLFGRQHPGRNFDLALQAMSVLERHREVVFQYLGPDAWWINRRYQGMSRILAPGPISSREVSSALHATDIALAPFNDGVSTRRTTLMSYLQHGIAVVGTDGHLTDQIFRAHAGAALHLTPVAQPALFVSAVVALAKAPSERERLGTGAIDLYRREFDWPVLVAHLVSELTRATSG